MLLFWTINDIIESNRWIQWFSWATDNSMVVVVNVEMVIFIMESGAHHQTSQWVGVRTVECVYDWDFLSSLNRIQNNIGEFDMNLDLLQSTTKPKTVNSWLDMGYQRNKAQRVHFSQHQSISPSVLYRARTSRQHETGHFPCVQGNAPSGNHGRRTEERVPLILQHDYQRNNLADATVHFSHGGSRTDLSEWIEAS